MSEFWVTLLLAAFVASLAWGLGFWMGWERGRIRGIFAERERRAAEQDRRYRAGLIKPPKGHSGASDAVERCRRKGGCCA